MCGIRYVHGKYGQYGKPDCRGSDGDKYIFETCTAHSSSQIIQNFECFAVVFVDVDKWHKFCPKFTVRRSDSLVHASFKIKTFSFAFQIFQQSA